MIIVPELVLVSLVQRAYRVDGAMNFYILEAKKQITVQVGNELPYSMEVDLFTVRCGRGIDPLDVVTPYTFVDLTGRLADSGLAEM